VRAFVRGEPGKVGALMQRLYGSDDLFPDALQDTRRPHQSVNFVTAHDGFCLYDLVAYDEKHNEANGHHNADGTNDNLSWNCGWEGDVNAPTEVLALRRQQAKNFAALLLLSNGIPMLLAGDEFLNTQRGNNNPLQPG
jgi:glycogen operon protein